MKMYNIVRIVENACICRVAKSLKVLKHRVIWVIFKHFPYPAMIEKKKKKMYKHEKVKKKNK